MDHKQATVIKATLPDKTSMESISINIEIDEEGIVKEISENE